MSRRGLFAYYCLVPSWEGSRSFGLAHGLSPAALAGSTFAATIAAAEESRRQQRRPETTGLGCGWDCARRAVMTMEWHCSGRNSDLCPEGEGGEHMDIRDTSCQTIY